MRGVQSYKWENLGVMIPAWKAIKLGTKTLSQMSNTNDHPIFFSQFKKQLLLLLCSGDLVLCSHLES